MKTTPFQTASRHVKEYHMHAIFRVLELQQTHTAKHSLNVARLASRIGMAMGLGPDELNGLYLGALLHDVGKLGITNDILLKPGSLSAEERSLIEKHPLIGYELLSGNSKFEMAARIALHHHERYDSRGYPLGLKGESIPKEAQIVAVADAFDAMVSDRPYRKGRSCEDALKEVIRNSGSQFNPEVVGVLANIKIGRIQECFINKV